MPKDCHRTGCCKKCFLFQEINSNQHLLGQHKNVHSVVHSEHLECIKSKLQSRCSGTYGKNTLCSNVTVQTDVHILPDRHNALCLQSNMSPAFHGFVFVIPQSQLGVFTNSSLQTAHIHFSILLLAVWSFVGTELELADLSRYQQSSPYFVSIW